MWMLFNALNQIFGYHLGMFFLMKFSFWKKKQYEVVYFVERFCVSQLFIGISEVKESRLTRTGRDMLVLIFLFAFCQIGENGMDLVFIMSIKCVCLIIFNYYYERKYDQWFDLQINIIAIHLAAWFSIQKTLYTICDMDK